MENIAKILSIIENPYYSDLTKATNIATLKDEKLKQIADKLVTTLGDMKPEEADQIVFNIAYLIYTEMLGLKGEIKKTKDIIACAGKESQHITEYAFIENE